MNTETWLYPNRRVLALAIVPAGLLMLLSFLLYQQLESLLLRALTASVGGCGFGIILMLAQAFVRPRIGYRHGEVLFFLKAGRPIAVPLEAVEGFFLGQGPMHLPVQTGKTETVNLVARFSRRSPDWMERDVKQALGKWTDGYATIRGTWCEPLNGEVIRRLNRRLREATEEFEAQCVSGEGSDQ